MICFPKYYFPVFVIACVLITACEKEETTCTEIIPNEDIQQVYFQYEVYNNAWGKTHRGWYMDIQGHLNYYNLPDEWMQPDVEGYISSSDLHSNLVQADSVIYTIDAKKIVNLICRIPEVEEDFFLHRKHKSYDGGSQSLYCFKWDTEKLRHKRILLATRGDFEQENLDFDAIALTIFFKQFGVF